MRHGPKFGRFSRGVALMAGKIEVTIADQNPVVRSGLEALVQRDGRFSVCGIHATGESLIEALKVKPVEIAIVGWTLPDMTGGAVLTRLKQEKWRTRVVIYTGERSGDVLRQAIKGGAWGFVSKTEDPQVLLDAGIVTTIRKTRGDDIDAACGQLAGEVKDRTRLAERGKFGKIVPVPVVEAESTQRMGTA